MEKKSAKTSEGGREEGRVSGLLLSAAIGMTAVAAAFGAPAAADDADKDEDQRTVTVIGRRAPTELATPKTTSPVLDTPLAIAVIPQEVFAQQGARNLTDILNNTPGITFNAGENGFGSGVSNFSMRGFDTSGSIFIDGSRDSGSYTRDSFNIEGVEVVKGPAGDNGRGSAGGYVNIVTKTPQEETAYSAGVSYGFDEYDSDSRVRTTLDLNQSLSDTASARLNVLYEDGGVVGRNVASRRTVGLAPSLAIGLGGETRLDVSLQYVSQQDTPDWGVPAAFVKDMLRHDPALNGEALRDKFYGLSADYDDVDSTVVLGRLERKLASNVTFSTQLRWSQTDRQSSFTFPTAYVNATQLVTTQRIGYARENESFSILSNLNAGFRTGPLQHRVAFGVEYQQEDADALSFPAQTNPGGAAVLATNPNPNRAGSSTVAATQRSQVSVDTLSAYLFDTIEFSPQWQLTGGVRVENYDVSISNLTVAGAPLGPNGYSVSETTLSGRVGLVYKPVEDASIYAAVGVAAMPPGSFLSNTDISREGDNAFPGFSAGLNSQGADVQQSVNYEVGVKWSLFGDKLLANGALFRTERQNVAITGLPALAQPVQLLGYGEQIVQGVELGVSGEITQAWSVFGGVLFMESERQHSAALDLGRCRASPGDFGAANAAACNATHTTSGDELAFTPELSANIWTTYTLPFGITLGGGARYVGESYVGRPDDAERIIPNNDANKLPSYWVANALVEYAVTPRATLRLNIDNITDEYYALSTNWSAQRVTLGPSRSFLVSLNLKL